jgi:hypothetical protein
MEPLIQMFLDGQMHLLVPIQIAAYGGLIGLVVLDDGDDRVVFSNAFAQN